MSNNTQQNKWEDIFDKKFVPSSLKWKNAEHCTCCSTEEEYEAIKSFISKLLKERETEAHDTENGYCCACEYDIAVFEGKIKQRETEIIEMIEEKYQSEKFRKITKSNRCKFARETETIGESKARQSGFLSALLVVKNLIKSNNE